MECVVMGAAPRPHGGPAGLVGAARWGEAAAEINRGSRRVRGSFGKFLCRQVEPAELGC